MKKVTVSINVFNGMPFFPEAVQSILGQTYRDLELFVVNDGSTDGTRDYLASIDDPRLTIIDQQNQGPSAASNNAIQRCQTKYLARMDADDVASPDRIEAQLAFMESHPDVGLLGGQTASLGKRGVSGSIKLPCDHNEIWDTLNAGHHAMAHPTLMMRTEVIQSVGGYWQHRLSDDDIDVMLRMGEVSKLANLDQVVLKYRLRQDSLCGSDLRGIRFSCDYALELARRRRNNLPSIMPDEFKAQQAARPWVTKAMESVDIHARTQYRLATEEMYGDKPFAGRARLLWAACCSPQLTLRRIRRMLRPATA